MRLQEPKAVPEDTTFNMMKEMLQEMREEQNKRDKLMDINMKNMQM